jgi:hypothetical protein
MPRFQSWLFNSIDQSLPVKLGRRVRLACQQLVARISQPGFASLPAAWEQVSKQVARIVLYPVYLIAIAAKRSYPQLSPDPKSAQPNPTLLLRPFQQLVIWAEDTELYAVRREPDNEPDNKPDVHNLTVQTIEAENTPGSISTQTNVSPQMFSPQLVQPQLVQPQPEQEALSQNEQPLDRIRQLIKAAIAYFFGKKTTVPPLETEEELSQPWLSMDDLFDDDSAHWPAIAQHKSARQDISPWEWPQLDGTNPAQTRSLKEVPNRALAKSPDRALTKNINKHFGIIPTASSKISDPLASKLAHASAHTTGEIIPDLSCWLDDSLDIELEEPLQTLQAWIETKATFLGYVYSPIMEFIHCLDHLSAKFEQWLVQLWQKIWDKLRGDI